MADEWSATQISQYRTVVETLRQESAKMAAGSLRISRQEGSGPLLDVTAGQFAFYEAQINALEVLISLELERGMEPVPHRRVDREEAIAYFMAWTGDAERFRERMVARVDRAIRLFAIDERENDELWLCRSRFVGDLAGHEGLGVVRNGYILRYETFIDY